MNVKTENYIEVRFSVKEARSLLDNLNGSSRVLREFKRELKLFLKPIDTIIQSSCDTCKKYTNCNHAAICANYDPQNILR
jgi:predicted RecB family nuclease